MSGGKQLKGWSVFIRENLRKHIIVKGQEEGTLIVITKILDPDTLKVHVIKSNWFESSFKRVIALYLDKFVEGNKLVI